MTANELSIRFRHNGGGVRLGLLTALALLPCLSLLLCHTQAASRVVAWGANDHGETDVPAGFTDVTAIEAGNNHTIALKQDGTVVAWGFNEQGQCTVPPGLDNVIALAAGAMHSLALRGDGTVVAWGDNTYWGGAVYSGQATVPAGLSDVVAIAAGCAHSLALKNDGQVVAWGWDFYGQTDLPAGLSDVAAVSAGAYFSLALTRDGQVIAWGDNNFGQTEVPAGLSNVVAIAAGHVHAVALQITSGRPVLMRQPQAGGVPEGQSLVLSVDAVGDEPLEYQWQRDGVDVTDDGHISGATTSRLTITDLNVADLGDYSMVVENSLGRVQSESVSVATSSPVLQVRRSGDQVVVAWSKAAKGMKLQRASTVANPKWQEVAGSESVTTLSLGISEGVSTFFRLGGAPRPKYSLIEGSFTWHEAKADAEARGGHLVTVTSEQEWTEIKSRLGDPSGEWGSPWIGATDEAREGEWTWVTGERWGYSHWCDGEPNNAGGQEHYADIISEPPGGGHCADGQWNDEGASWRACYILEFD